jgi:hypothetical protein
MGVTMMLSRTLSHILKTTSMTQSLEDVHYKAATNFPYIVSYLISPKDNPE